MKIRDYLTIAIAFREAMRIAEDENERTIILSTADTVATSIKQFEPSFNRLKFDQMVDGWQEPLLSFLPKSKANELKGGIYDR